MRPGSLVSRHTPGPWHIESSFSVPMIVRKETGERVAEVQCKADVGEERDNATLLAAAPELLAAAEKVMKELQDFLDTCELDTARKETLADMRKLLLRLTCDKAYMR